MSAVVQQQGGISFQFLFRWLIQAVFAGLGAAAIVESFRLLLDAGTTFVASLPGFPLVYAMLAALVAGLTIYRVAPSATGEGIPAYLKTVRPGGSPLPLKATIFKYPAALLTLTCAGTGGTVGPIGRVSAGFSQSMTMLIARLFPSMFADRREHDRAYHAPTTAAISGLAAAVAAIFHAPIGGAVFAVEIIQRDQLRYHQIFPAVMASSAAVLFARIFDWPAMISLSVRPFEANAGLVIPVLLTGLAAGGLGVGYTRLYQVMSTLFRRESHRHLPIKLVVGMVAAASIGWLVNPELLGARTFILTAAVHGHDAVLYGRLAPTMPVVLVAVTMIVVKMVANCITVASGMSAGFTAPAAIMGSLLGVAIAALFGYDPGSAPHVVLVVSGFAGALAATMNIPLAASIIAMEVFATSYGVPAGLASMIGFQTARYNTIYDVAAEK